MKDISKKNIREDESTLSNTNKTYKSTSDKNDINIDSKISTRKFCDSLENTKKNIKSNQYINKNPTEEKILCSLDDLKHENWNQFEENQNLYKIESSYSEDKYNSRIDQDKITNSLKNMAQSIENSLKNNKTNNTHLNEERGIFSDNETDENKYSNVVRKSDYKKKSSSSYRFWYFMIFFIILLISIYIYSKNKFDDDIVDLDENVVLEISEIGDEDRIITESKS